MLQLSRFRGLVLAGFLVLAATLACDGLLTLAVGPASQWLPFGEYPADRKVVTDTAERLSGALKDLGDPKSRPVKGLGILLGQSSLECAVDARQLGDEDGLSLRWLNLFGLGGSMHKIDEQAELVFLSKLIPESVVFAINPHFLIGTDYRLMRVWERKATGNAIKPLIWTWENRTNFNHVVQIGIYDTRNALLSGLGVRFDAIFPAMKNPWEHTMYRQIRQTEAEQRAQLAYDAEVEWFLPRRYRPDTSNARAFVSLCQRFRDAGSKVTVVILPMPTMFREVQPAEAKALVLDLARNGIPGGPIPVIDLEDQVDDPLFLDLHHLNIDGRAACTSLLARRLKAASAPE